MREENKTPVIKLNDLPLDIQEKIREQYNLTKEQNAIVLPFTNITINNHNRYYITNNTRVLRNEGTINEKQDSLLDIFARAAGRAAGKTWKWLQEESK